MNKLEEFSPRPATAYVLLTFAAFLWGLGTVIARGVHEIVPPVGLSFWRAVIVVVVLSPFVLPELLRKWPVIAAHWKFLALMGALQLGAQAVFVLALNFTTAINAALENASQPAITAVMAWLLIRERVSLRQSLGILIALIGITVMVVRADLSALMAFDFNIGDLFVVLAVSSWALYAILLPRVPRALGLTTTLFIVMSTGGIALLPFYIVESLVYRPVSINLPTVATIVGLGLFITSTSVFIWNAGVRAVGPNRATAFMNLIPIFGAGLAILILGERLFLYHLAGAVLVWVGIQLVIRRKRE